MTETNFDVVIIGGGPGGYVAAIRAAQLGMKTVVVEREHMGGICLNWGCIPTKALLRSADVYRTILHAKEFGVEVKSASVQWEKVIERSRGVAQKLAQGVQGLMKKHKITIINGHGALNGKGKVKVDHEGKRVAELSAKHIIIATGARARALPGLEPDGKLVWSYKEAMVAPSLPKKLLVVGSGAIGVEFASFFRTMGSEVTLMEVQPRILPVEDEEISKLAHKSFTAQGIQILTNTTLTALERGKDSVKASFGLSEGAKKTESFDRVIMAVGIVGNTENLGLEGTKVKIEKGQILTNEWLETGEKNVYAIGDVAGAPWLAHKASHEGVVCVEKIAGVKDVHPVKRENIPGCTYCHPQIASVGLTEAQAKAKGFNVKVGRFPGYGNGKAIAMGETEALVKTVFDAVTGELLGAHLIGAEVTEMIQGFVIGKTMEATEAEFMHTIFPHPTLSEMMHESVLDAFGKVVHV